MTDTTDWLERNRAMLTAWVELNRNLLRALAARPDRYSPPADAALPSTDGHAPAETLVQIAEGLGLTRFARGALMLAAAAEVDAEIHHLCGLCTGQDGPGRPTFGLALRALPGGNWTDLHPEAPLRRFGLLEVDASGGLLQAPMRIDEGVLHHLFGFDYRDATLRALVRPLPMQTPLVPSHAEDIERVGARWQANLARGRTTVLTLHGPDPDDRLQFAGRMSARIGWQGWVVSAERLPADARGRADLARRWRRLAALDRRTLVLDAEALSAQDPAMDGVRWIAGQIASPLIISSRRPLGLSGFDQVRHVMRRPLRAEQHRLWALAWRSVMSPDSNTETPEPAEPGARPAQPHDAADAAQPAPDPASPPPLLLDRLINAFDMSAGAIDLAIEAAVGEALTADEDLEPVLWRVCRAQNRGELDELARRVTAETTWHDLVLPDEQMSALRQITAFLDQRVTLFDRWGLDGGGQRGLGVAVLFAGPPGTGKTTAAEAIADELSLDLYHIDLSAVISKYIGETERNLARIFDAAEASGAVLLFDEADALFGKRTAVRDSHDRYANVEVSYLLQRIEAFRGLAVLTTNMKQNLDPAFVRRLRYVIDFPVPDRAARVDIWRRVLPAAIVDPQVDFTRLGQLNAAGGIIRNIALTGAALAARAGVAVGMAHLLEATRAECRKMGRKPTMAEIKGWVP